MCQPNITTVTFEILKFYCLKAAKEIISSSDNTVDNIADNMDRNRLRDDSFFLEGKILKLNARGNVMVLFTSTDCASCKHFEPIFEREIIPQLSGYGWIFAKYIVQENPQREAIRQSNFTNTPLSRSPTTILYSNGVPIGMKVGAADGPTMINFANQVLTEYKNTVAHPPPPPSQQYYEEPPQQHYRQHQHPPQQPPPPQRVPAARPPPRKEAPSNVRYSSTGVPIIDGYYGIPSNMNSESEFIEYNQAYKQDTP